MDKLIKDVEKYSGMGSKVSVPSLFKKKAERSDVVEYLELKETTCYICNKMNSTFDRYIATFFHLYHTEESFRLKFKACKGFCSSHYKVLTNTAPEYLSGEELSGFYKLLNHLYIENMKRVRDDLEWFINKFDYRYAEEPWKNAKDAMPRAIQKTNSISNIS